MDFKKITASLIALGVITPAFAENFRINDFRIEGEQHTSEATVRSFLPVKEGDTFTEQEGENIIRSLHSSGFYENVLLEQNGNTLIITVSERPVISSVTIEGAKVLPNDAILKQMATMKGGAATKESELIIQGSDKRSHDEKLADYESGANYNTANALASTGLAKGDFFSQEALQRALQALMGAYQEQGKRGVKITPEVTPLAQNRVAIKITVDEGTTTRVKEIDFVGNEVFSDRKLANQIGLTDGTAVSWLTKSNVFSWEKFSQDKTRLENFYHRKGYFDAKVDFDEVQREPLNEDQTREKVIIKVYEGKQYRWGNFNIIGDTKDVPKEQLAKHLKKLKTGKLSNNLTLQTALGNMRLELQSMGYAYANVDAKAVHNEDGTLDINIEVAPGARIAVREINITGNNKTRDEVIRRELRQMEGATYDQKKIDRSRQRLNQLGYFENVDMKAVPTAENDQQVDVNVDVKERSTGSINVSAGWSQDDGLVVAGGVAQDNVFGTGKSASVSVSRSKVNQNANLSFTDPYFTPDGVSMAYSLFGSNYNPYKQNSSPRSYKITRYGGQMMMGIPITEYDRVNVGLGAENLRIGLFPQSPIRYQRFVQENGARNWIYKGMASWYRNTTDDAYWPTRGYQTSLTAEAGLPGSGLQYYQLGHQNTWYFPITTRVTLMLNGQIGYSGRYGKTKELPFLYAQTGGGLGSVRGFESGTLGPKFYDTLCYFSGNSTPAPAGSSGTTCYQNSVESYGGSFAANANAELLFPFPGVKDSRSVRLSLFADAGSVWDNKTYNNATYSSTNLNGTNGFYAGTHKASFKEELRYSTGAALTWISPMGPIKLSYAYPLKKKDKDQIQRFQFQLGTVF